MEARLYVDNLSKAATQDERNGPAGILSGLDEALFMAGNRLNICFIKVLQWIREVLPAPGEILAGFPSS